MPRLVRSVQRLALVVVRHLRDVLRVSAPRTVVRSRARPLGSINPS